MRGKEYKSRIFEMHLKLKDQQLKTIMYISMYRLLYQNLVVTANQKSIIDIHTKKKNESKHNTKDSHQITREQNKRGREEKRSTKTNPGLPWWCSGWESACQCGGHGFKPWSGKIPHAAEQLSPWATITEPAHLEPVLLNKRDHDSERPAHRDEEWPPLAPTRESPRTETKTQHRHK